MDGYESSDTVPDSQLCNSRGTSPSVENEDGAIPEDQPKGHGETPLPQPSQSVDTILSGPIFARRHFNQLKRKIDELEQELSNIQERVIALERAKDETIMYVDERMENIQKKRRRAEKETRS